ncbi:hypothetical protein N7499_009615 [Penicillium canescens]|nr:hypothetical protein N7499_009615 [Penicillium canescens]
MRIISEGPRIPRLLYSWSIFHLKFYLSSLQHSLNSSPKPFLWRYPTSYTSLPNSKYLPALVYPAGTKRNDLEQSIIGLFGPVLHGRLHFADLSHTAGGARNSTPLNEIYFLQADTGNIPGAPSISRWTFWNVCGVTNNGRNDCGKSHPDYPFDPQATALLIPPLIFPLSSSERTTTS